MEEIKAFLNSTATPTGLKTKHLLMMIKTGICDIFFLWQWYRDTLHLFDFKAIKPYLQEYAPNQLRFLEEGFTSRFHLGVQAAVSGSNIAVWNKKWSLQWRTLCLLFTSKLRWVGWSGFHTPPFPEFHCLHIRLHPSKSLGNTILFIISPTHTSPLIQLMPRYYKRRRVSTMPPLMIWSTSFWSWGQMFFFSGKDCHQVSLQNYPYSSGRLQAARLSMTREVLLC